MPLLADSLVEFYDLEEVRVIWKQILDASLGRVQLPMQINARGRDGSSTSAMIVSSMAEAEAYMQACKSAIARLDPDATGVVSADTLGVQINMSYRPVLA